MSILGTEQTFCTMKTKLLFKHIPLDEVKAQHSVQTIEFDPMSLYEHCPHGYRANKSTLQYRFTNEYLILSCEIVPKESSHEFSEAKPASH